MAEIKPEIETFAKIKVVGVGGSGGSSTNRMIAAKIRGVEFIALNTDVQALHYSQAQQKLHIGKTVTRGLGAGMDPEMGLRAAEESENEIRELLKGSDMVFVTCGLGGGTGSGASPVVAAIAKDLGALTVSVVTKPFMFEGAQRKAIAEAAYEKLASHVDTIITIPNDRILQIIDRKTSLIDAFEMVDDVLRQGVQGISELITVPGLINVDFADVRSIMSNRGSALMGIGRGHGENRAADAAKAAVASPLLEVSVDGARGILFTITGGSNLGMYEVSEAAKTITQSADPQAKVIFGAIIDEQMKDEVKVTVIATGFDAKPAVPKVKTVFTSGPMSSPGFSSRPTPPVQTQPPAPVYQAPPPEPLEKVTFQAPRPAPMAQPAAPNYQHFVPPPTQAYQNPTPAPTYQQASDVDEDEEENQDELLEQTAPAAPPQPVAPPPRPMAPQPASYQPHVKPPQYAATNQRPMAAPTPPPPLPPRPSLAPAPTSEEEDLEIPAFIRKKMM